MDPRVARSGFLRWFRPPFRRTSGSGATARSRWHQVFPEPPWGDGVGGTPAVAVRSWGPFPLELTRRGSRSGDPGGVGAVSGPQPRRFGDITRCRPQVGLLEPPGIRRAAHPLRAAVFSARFSSGMISNRHRAARGNWLHAGWPRPRAGTQDRATFW